MTKTCNGLHLGKVKMGSPGNDHFWSRATSSDKSCRFFCRCMFLVSVSSSMFCIRENSSRWDSELGWTNRSTIFFSFSLGISWIGEEGTDVEDRPPGRDTNRLRIATHSKGTTSPNRKHNYPMYSNICCKSISSAVLEIRQKWTSEVTLTLR